MTTIAATDRPTAPACLLLDVKETAELLNASPRTVYRLSDAGRMPRPVKIGALVRWRADEIRRWIDAGCPNCRTRATEG